MKYLDINLRRHVENMYVENHKSLMKDAVEKEHRVMFTDDKTA